MFVSLPLGLSHRRSRNAFASSRCSSSRIIARFSPSKRRLFPSSKSFFLFFDSLQEFLVPFTDQDLFDAMESDPSSYDTEELIDMIEQLILYGNVPWFDVAIFTIPDDASLLLFAVSSTSFGSITRFSLCLLFSLSLKIDPIPRWVVSLFLSLHRRRSRIRLEGSTFSFFLSFQTEMSCRLQRSQSSQIAPSKALQTLHWRYRERIVVRFRLISKAKGAGIALGCSLSIADSRSIRPPEHNQAS